VKTIESCENKTSLTALEISVGRIDKCLSENGKMARGRISYAASSDIERVIASIGRSEDISLSPNDDRLAIAGFLDQRIYLFAVEIKRELPTLSVEISDYLVISSPSFRHPHGVTFLDNDHIIVCSRSGGVDVFRLPEFEGKSRERELLPVGSINGRGHLLAKVKTPGSVDSYALSENRYRVLVCNNKWHFVSSHVVDLTGPVRIQDETILLRDTIKIPDGISISSDSDWIAISNHVSGEALVYRNDAALGPGSDPHGIFYGSVCPHGIQFAPNGNRLFVADAASQYLHVYETNDGEWRGKHGPSLSIRMMDDDLFLAGRHAAREGGLKGVDLDSTGRLLMTTHMHDVIGFYNVDLMLSAPSVVDSAEMGQFALQRDEGLESSQKRVLERRWDIASRLRGEAASIFHLALRARKKARAERKTLQCKFRNRLSRSSILDPNGPVLSLTTHGSRLALAYIAIESIAAGSRKPSRCILWLDEENALQDLPISLQRLVSRGLEIRFSDDFGPHTKYYPYVVKESAFQKPLVTADDDIIYPKYWLERLVSAHESDPSVIHCHRARRMKVQGLQLAPYNEWRYCVDRQPSHLNFVTGAGGAIYPTQFLEFLKHQGPAFLECCPKADDIWLTVNAFRGGFRVAQVDDVIRPDTFTVVPGSQKEALSKANVTAGENHIQLLKTLTASDVAALARAQEYDLAVV
jgi:hypothetical protein